VAEVVNLAFPKGTLSALQHQPMVAQC